MTGWLRYHDEPIILTSGGQSHWFVDAGEIFEDVYLRARVISCWEKKLNYWSTWHFIGVPEGGVKWARALAVYVNTKRGNNPATWGRPDNDIPDGSSIAVIEDVVTTGQSLFSVVKKYTSATTLAVVVRNPDVYVGCAWAIIDLREGKDVRLTGT